MKRLNLSVWSLFGALSIALPAFAQGLPPGLATRPPAMAGQEVVATSGFEAPVPKPADIKDETEAKLSAGALFTGGNSESVAATASGKLRVRRGMNVLAAAAASNYGAAKTEGSAERETTVENFQGKLRYDRFLAEHLAAFVALSGLRDRFQGLDLRLNFDPGLAFYFHDELQHRFWLEVGYDYQYDIRRRSSIREAQAQNIYLSRAESRHSVRGFLGYENTLTQTLTFDAGLEYLQALKDTENYRINWVAGLTSHVGGSFSVAVTFNLRYDNNPLPGIKDTDYASAVSLVYQFL